jgi:hypothetical protein
VAASHVCEGLSGRLMTLSESSILRAALDAVGVVLAQETYSMRLGAASHVMNCKRVACLNDASLRSCSQCTVPGSSSMLGRI